MMLTVDVEAACLSELVGKSALVQDVNGKWWPLGDVSRRVDRHGSTRTVITVWDGENHEFELHGMTVRVAIKEINS